MKRGRSAEYVLAGGVVSAVIGLGVMAMAPHAVLAKQPTTAPRRASTSANSIPAEMVGEWFEGTVGPTTYWDSQTGKYLGSGRQMGSILELHADGTFKKYVYIYMKTYALVTESWTSMAGTAAVAGDQLTLTVTKGHYKTGGSSKPIDRDMTAEEVTKAAATYAWRMETNKDTGRVELVLPFDDGSAFRYRRTDEEGQSK
jgi:hypothetical protein